MNDYETKMAFLQDVLIKVITEHAGDEIGAAVIVLVDKKSQPMCVMAPGSPDPEVTREILCRGISMSYDTPVKVPYTPADATKQ